MPATDIFYGKFLPLHQTAGGCYLTTTDVISLLSPADGKTMFAKMDAAKKIWEEIPFMLRVA